MATLTRGLSRQHGQDVKSIASWWMKMRAALLTLLGLVLGLVPFALGAALGLEALVYLSVIAPALPLGAGMLIAKTSRGSAWTGIALCSAGAVAGHVVIFLLQAVTNPLYGITPFRITQHMLINGSYYLALTLIAAGLVIVGAWLGGAWRRPSLN